MGGNILTKENFVELVMKEQERKKESGIKLTKMDDTSFYNLLTDVLLEFGGDTKKEKPKVTKKTTKRVAKKETKADKEVLNNEVISNKEKVTEVKTTKKVIVEEPKIVIPDNEVLQKAKKEAEITETKEQEVVKPVANKETEETKEVIKAQPKVVEEVVIKSEKLKEEKPVFKTKDIPRKDGLMQIAFDF